MVRRTKQAATGDEPSGAALERVMHVLDEYDEVYDDLRWMVLGCPSPDDEFERLSGVAKRPWPSVREWAQAAVPLPPGYLRRAIERDRGAGLTVDVQTVQTGRSIAVPDDAKTAMVIWFSGRPVTASELSARVKEAWPRLRKSLGRRGDLEDPDRPARTALLIWLTQRQTDALGWTEAAERWKQLTTRWSSWLIAKHGLSGIPVPLLAEQPEAYYAFLEWRDLHTEDRKRKRVGLTIIKDGVESFTGRRITEMVVDRSIPMWRSDDETERIALADRDADETVEARVARAAGGALAQVPEQ